MTEAQKKLPVFATLLQSITYTFLNAGLMFRLIWLWLLALSGAMFLAFALGYGHIVKRLLFAYSLRDFQWPLYDMLAYGAVALLYMAATYSITVAWHRGLLMNEQPGAAFLRFGYREIHYFGRTLVMVAIAVGFFTPILILFVIAFMWYYNVYGENLYLEIAIFAVVATCTLVFMQRFTLVLPGAAVGDQRMTLRESWKLTEGNAWRIFIGGTFIIGVLHAIAGFVVSFAFTFVIGFMAGASGSEAEIKAIPMAQDPVQVWQLLLRFTQAAVSTVILFLAVSYLSFCYWFFVPPPQDGDLAR